MKMNSRRLLFVLLLAALSPVSLVYATPIFGTADISGGALGVAATSVDFFGTLPTCSTPGLGVAGCFSNVGLPTGSFVGAANGTVQDFTLASTGGRLSGAINIVGWMTFNNGVTLDTTFVAPGVGVSCATLTPAQLAAVGTVCTPHVLIGGVDNASPFTLQNLAAGGVSASMALALSGYTGSSATGQTFYTGALTSQFTGTNIGILLGTIGAGGTIVNSWSGTLAPVPEPGTVYFAVGAVLFLLGAASFRRAQLR
jgi:hypothetical protein